MSTVNIVLLAVLTTMIGFAIGNAYGQQKMKMILNDLISRIVSGINAISGDKKGEEEPK